MNFSSQDPGDGSAKPKAGGFPDPASSPHPFSAAPPIALPARLRHDYENLRKHIPAGEEALRRLLAFRDVRDERDARSRLEALFPGFRRSLFRSPYYAGLLEAKGLSPEDLATLEDLRGFPMLDRATLKARWRDLPALDLGDPGCADAVVIRSSGTTGDPADVLRDGYDQLHMWTVLQYWSAILGVELPRAPVVVLLCALPGGLEYESRLPTLFDGTLLRISTVRPRPLERLLDADPHVLFSDPAGFHWLAARERVPGPRLMLSSAQHFPRALRERVAERVEAPVVNYYSTSETGPIAWECLGSPGRFHVLAPDVWVESIASETGAGSSGAGAQGAAASGDLLVTRLRPSALPLLRYRTGDAGTVAFGTCACGHAGWTIDGFEGRSACFFVNPRGESVDAWQLAWIFKHFPLRAFRLTQSGRETFRLEIAAGAEGKESAPALLERLSGALILMGWKAPEIEAIPVEEIDCSGQKPTPFRAEWKPAGNRR
jgi:phenylacetate-CoA ligase